MLETDAPKVDGEAFFITNAKPLPAWTLFRKVWAAVGDRSTEGEVWCVPAWFSVGLGTVLEWLFWLFSFGTRTPPDFRSHTLRWINEERTFSIDFARERLGYQHKDDIDQSSQCIKDGVAWALMQNRDFCKNK
ncbi:uncharacterized protein LY89DRAFT_740515 [Mollisia scopiformis]|uniref:3-beta hydroxysteroid dehydrogenase/isomerase domain-containing protein n=1 Tax=Mollisia scopiformis TaxID=149040 RepID=A0A132BCM0_MOLSC|nr:uncharacterized protein LY89DRAFT_740515 [Mollisia scopiformis]KUJ10121.1 hypothetical protein LY89DRAFT_740515 [Mollisia scopiformis]